MKGISSTIEELREILDQHMPDILLLSETHLVPGENVRLPNYAMHRDDRLTLLGSCTVTAVVKIKPVLFITAWYCPTGHRLGGDCCSDLRSSQSPSPRLSVQVTEI